MAKQMGGSRPGAGRPALAEKTVQVTLRMPDYLVKHCQERASALGMARWQDYLRDVLHNDRNDVQRDQIT